MNFSIYEKINQCGTGALLQLNKLLILSLLIHGELERQQKGHEGCSETKWGTVPMTLFNKEVKSIAYVIISEEVVC